VRLHEAFGIQRGDVVAFIGAGGKTSTLVNLGHELAEMGWRVLATTTTNISADQLAILPSALPPDANSQDISNALTNDRFVFLYDRIKGGAVYGPEPSYIPRLMDAVDSDVMLIEADAAGGLLLKAPFDDEPIIPPETSLVIPVVSLSALDKPLDDEHVYNVQAIIDRYGFPKGTRIRSPWIAQVLRDETLGLRGVPEKARTIAFLNQSTMTDFSRSRARIIARLALRTGRLESVVIGSARASQPVYEIQRPIGAVVLAAGLSSRMGQPKVLLPWENDHTIIEHIVMQLIAARIDHIVVVTGHMAKAVKSVVKPLGAQAVYNRSYKSGEMLSSVKAGLRAMPGHIAATLLVLGDQPRIQPKVVYQVLTRYAETDAGLIAPSYKMRRGHPILIGRKYWTEMLNLPRSGSPREVIENHADAINYVTVDTDSVLRDVDTPQDYAEERWRAGLTGSDG
jgi:molybdenum cofactor cytidylyltransferase